MSIKITRRSFTLGASAALSIGAGTGFSHAATGDVVVGTWGGDYQTLLQKNVADAISKPAGLGGTTPPPSP